MKHRTHTPHVKSGALAGLLALAALCGIAHAGDITLYERSGFGGRQLELRDSAPSLRDAGFNDRASSLVVRSGRWEVCSDEGFRGTCTQLERGEYPELDPRLNNRISSVRELGRNAGNYGGRPGGDNDGYYGNTNGPVPAPGRPGRRPVLNMYSGPNFGGQSISITEDANNLREQGFNDSTMSIVVLEGNWSLCRDANYGGECRVYSPGRYPDLNGMSRAISSARVVPGGRYEDNNDGRPAPGGWDRPHQELPPPPANNYPPRANVELFSGGNFGGDRFEVGQDLSSFRSGGFNDRIQSFVIHEGQWEFCTDGDFRGRCTVFGPGRYGNLGGLANQLSSMRRVR